RVFALERGDRVNCVCATDGLHARFRQAEVRDLPFPDQVFHGSCDIFDWEVPADTILIEKIDSIRSDPFERSLGNFFDVCGPATESALSARFKREAELCRDHHLITQRRQRLANEFLIREWPISFSSVKERDAALDRGSNQ